MAPPSVTSLLIFLFFVFPLSFLKRANSNFADMYNEAVWLMLMLHSALIIPTGDIVPRSGLHEVPCFENDIP